LCETDYFKRLDLLCFACGSALRGSYITALDRKYHIEHFTCSVCPTVFGAQDSYYEHGNNVYCHYHYSTRFAQRCQGCQNAILKQFVEIFRNGENQHWHPECYMIHKYWNVRLHSSEDGKPRDREWDETASNAGEDTRRAVREEEENVEEKVMWIWKSLSAFEERAATSISDMLLHVSNCQYYEAIKACRKFIVHIELFFECTDDLDARTLAATGNHLAYAREAKLLCKKIVSFFQLLSDAQPPMNQRTGVTQNLLSLVTGLAHYLKLLIRIDLQGALKLERDSGNSEALTTFLEKISTLEARIGASDARDPLQEAAPFVHRNSDACPVCEKPVEDKCFRKEDRVFHVACFECKNCGVSLRDNPSDARYSPSRRELFCSKCGSNVPDAYGGFIRVTKLQQYIHLLKVAHARLLFTLSNTGAIQVANGKSYIPLR
jgi:LIM domain